MNIFPSHQKVGNVCFAPLIHEIPGWSQRQLAKVAITGRHHVNYQGYRMIEGICGYGMRGSCIF